MNRGRILLLSVALVAGGLAAFMATRGGDEQIAPTRAQVEQEARTKIVIAVKSIGVGERLNPSLIRWEEWPSNAVRPEYITIDAVPDGLEELSGAVARFEFFEGEPIREAKLVHSDQGFLSAVIEPGMRAVSIGVTAESGAGGFIVPNDRVDVILTSESADNIDRSDTILQNVKVLVIDRRLGQLGETGGAENPDEPENNTFEADTIAVLELTPEQAEIVINSSEIGQLALVLRSVADFNEEIPEGIAMRKNTTVRMIRYGKGQDILPVSIEMASPAQISSQELTPAGNNIPGMIFDQEKGEMVEMQSQTELNAASASELNPIGNGNSIESVRSIENAMAQ